MTKQQVVSDYHNALRELNAQFWMLLALSAHGAGVAAAAAPLDGHAYAKSLQFLLPHSIPHVARLRLRNRHMSSDLRDLCTRAEAWLPAYFIVLAKSLTEGTVHDLVSLAVTNDAGVRTAFTLFCKNTKRKPKQGLDSLAAAIARGDFATAGRVLNLAPQRAPLNALVPTLEQYSRVRNRLAHRLDQELAKGPSVTTATVQTYLETTGELIELVAKTV